MHILLVLFLFPSFPKALFHHSYWSKSGLYFKGFYVGHRNSTHVWPAPLLSQAAAIPCSLVVLSVLGSPPPWSISPMKAEILGLDLSTQ